MRLLYVTMTLGDRVYVRAGGWGQMSLYFRGKQPDHDQLLLLDFKGLTTDTPTAIVEWLGELEGEKRREEEICEIPESVWRPAVLDDVMEAGNHHTVGWHLQRLFPLTDFDAFFAKWLPEAKARLEKNLALDGELRRGKALPRLEKFLERIGIVTAAAPRRCAEEAKTIFEKADADHRETIQQEGYDFERWVGAAEGALSNLGRLNLLLDIKNELLDPSVADSDVLPALERIHQSLKLRNTVPEVFFEALQHKVRLPPTVEGKRIDISGAREETVQLGWPLIKGQRVGSVVPGRTALVVRDRNQNPKYFIRGERKLKFRVKRAGGKLERYGNTLVLSEAGDGLAYALLEVDRLDTLANLSPKQALATVADRDLPSDHPVFAAARAAEDDPKQSRVLADLLIELRVGVDADIARQLARAQSRSNRR